jgi:hypothetical protein
MVQSTGAASQYGDAQAKLPANALRNFCISFGLQRHTYYVLKAVSVFYFTSVLGNYSKGQDYHNAFFAALSLAPVLVAVFVTTLSVQLRSVYIGQFLLLAAFIVLTLNANQ